jgi:predicted lipoprotein with Yx(FWY)xxD motif
MRADGVQQWSFRGQPLYSYSGDNKIGDVKGNGHAGWRAVVLEAASGVPAWVTLQNSDLGPVFADPAGKTLYRFFPADLEKLKELVCNDDCIQANWKPVLAEGNAKTVGNWRPVSASGGTQQWSYKGGLVYTFIHDRRPGDTFGDKFGGMESPWSPILQATLILSGP